MQLTVELYGYSDFHINTIFLIPNLWLVYWLVLVPRSVLKLGDL